MSDSLEQRMVPCPKCENGKVREWLHNEYITVDCTDCDGTGEVLEPAEVWAERNARIARVLAAMLVCRGCVGHELQDECLPEVCLFGATHIPEVTAKFIEHAARLKAAARECGRGEING